MDDADRELLERHAPLLRYDSQSAYRSLAAAAMTDWRGNALRRADGSAIAIAGGEPPLALGTLSAYPPGHAPAAGDALDQCPDQLAAAAHFQSDRAYADRAYGRVVRGPERTWLQYWFFYYYNPHSLLGFARHEGDWEMIQLGLAADGRPEAATYAQHDWGLALDWDELTRDGPDHPVVFVAPFSNASYPRPGRFPYLGGIDHPRGDGERRLAAIEPFGDWASWPGRWGNSSGVLGGKLGGRSPSSPALHGLRWDDPAEFHRRSALPSRGGALRASLAGVASALGGRPPPPPRLDARRQGSSVAVGYELPGGISRGRRLYLTVHDADQPERVLGRSAFRARRFRGQAVVALRSTATHMLVRGSAFGAGQARSDPVEIAV